MPDRPASCAIKSRRLRWLLHAAIAALVVLIAPRLVWAARIPAPMCTPDAQSMAAPLQRTPTSSAEIRRGPGCTLLSGSNWEILPNRKVPSPNWYLSTADPVWISSAFIRAVGTNYTISILPIDLQDVKRTEISSDIFRPPISWQYLCEGTYLAL